MQDFVAESRKALWRLKSLWRFLDDVRRGIDNDKCANATNQGIDLAFAGARKQGT